MNGLFSKGANASSLLAATRTRGTSVAATYLVVVLTIAGVGGIGAAEGAGKGEWRPLFNGTNLEGWHTVVRNGRSDDLEHFVTVENGEIHMYKDAAPNSPQPAGYIVTDKEYSNYHLRLQYKWGTKRFGGRSQSPRDAGVLYHVVGKDGVWPRSVECQIQENDVGDIFTVNTRLTAMADPQTTNVVLTVVTNKAGTLQTNRSAPVFLDVQKGGAPFVQGVANNIRRVIRNPMNEHEGWNTVEVIVRGDEATYVVNGKVNNHAKNLQQMTNNDWVPLNKGKIALQFEFAEVFYRNVEMMSDE